MNLNIRVFRNSDVLECGEPHAHFHRVCRKRHHAGRDLQHAPRCMGRVRSAGVLICNSNAPVLLLRYNSF